MIELRVRLQPKQKKFNQTVNLVRCTFYGGAKGGGKSKGLRDIMLKRRFEYDGSQGAIFRRTYSELEGNHIRPMFKEFPKLKQFYNDSKKILTLPNGSTLEFCHCAREADVELYQGREFHDLGIEEAGQWPESMVHTLRGSNRSSIKGIKPKLLLTGNPGGIGHKWLKRLFIERDFNEREDPNDYAFIQALVQDNLALMKNDPEYLKTLEAEPNETLRKAYLYGDWDIFAGQFFSEIRRDKHMCEPFNIPEHWNRFGAYDYGFNHPASFGWFAVSEDGEVYLYRELMKAQMRPDQFARTLLEFDDTKKLITIAAGHDCWIARGGGPTIAEDFSKCGIQMRKANIDRIQGASQVRRYLAWQNMSKDKEGKSIDGTPKLKIFRTCPISFDCLTRMQHDPKNVEDVLKVDASEGNPYTGDDAYDMIRMGVMSRPILSQPLPKDKKWGYDSPRKNSKVTWTTV